MKTREKKLFKQIYSPTRVSCGGNFKWSKKKKKKREEGMEGGITLHDRLTNHKNDEKDQPNSKVYF